MSNGENEVDDEGEANYKDYNEGEEISEVEEPCGDVVISIKKMLEKLRPANTDSSICRVSKQLCKMDNTAYVPQVISIGPFHRHSSKDLIATEQYKHQGLCNFLRRLDDHKEMNDDSQLLGGDEQIKIKEDRLLKELVVNAESWVEEARKCYAEAIDMKDEEFVMMMLVDGCFIVEFFILVHDQYITSDDHKFPQIKDNVDFLFYQEIIPDVYLDLIKLENQLPFFLLQHLFDKIPKQNTPKSQIFIPGNDSSTISFLELTFKVLRLRWVENFGVGIGIVFYEFNPEHLLQYLSLYFYKSKSVNYECRHHKKIINYFLSFFHVCRFWNKPDVETSSEQGSVHNDVQSYGPDNWTKEKQHEKKRWIPPSITELCEAGVTLKMAKKSPFLTNISFENGVLEISHIVIDCYFETMTRNLIAYEHFYAKYHKDMNVISYVLFMDYLISTEKDVSLLRKAGIIINDNGGSDKEVSELFNTLGKFVTRPGNTSFYIKELNDISKALSEHRNRRWNKLKASLKHNYFNTPWAGISVFAATFLILLTLLQTIFSGISTF